MVHFFHFRAKLLTKEIQNTGVINLEVAILFSTI